MEINKKDRIKEIVDYLLDKNGSLKSNLKDEKEESYVCFDGRSKIRINATSKKDDSKISLDFYIEKKYRPENWKCECGSKTVDLNGDYKDFCDALYAELNNTTCPSGENSDADGTIFNYEYTEPGEIGEFNGNMDEFFARNSLGKVNGKEVKIPRVASWAFWQDNNAFPGNLNSVRTELNANIILLAENISAEIKTDWENFHGTSPGDNRLKSACQHCPGLHGAYITDLIKNLNDADGSAVEKYFKSEAGERLRESTLQMFIREIELLRKCGKLKENVPLYIILLGTPVKNCFALLEDKIRSEFKDFYIAVGEAYHFSYTISVEKYCEHIKKLYEKMQEPGRKRVERKEVE